MAMISSALSGKREPRPLPRAVFTQNLLCQGKITLGSAGTDVIEHYGLAVAWCFGKGYIARDYGIEHLVSEVVFHLLGNLMGKAVP